MRSVHQVIAGAAPGDAVTVQALRLQRLLHAWGYRSEIFAEHVHPDVAADVRRLTGRGDRRLSEGPLLLRYSIWSTGAEAAVASDVPLGVVYHNVTPPDLLRAANPQIAALCEEGRARLRLLRGRPMVLLADSSFNAADLREAGVGEATVVPLLIDPVEPRSVSTTATATPRLLTVGRIAPNKRLEDALRVLAALQRSRSAAAQLTAIGAADGFERYQDALLRFGRDLGVRRAVFTGRVPRPVRDTAYAEASVYLCMSVHEGFCLPLVEAMQHGVPVVARAAGAVPETLGGAGLCLPDEDAAVFAEAVWEVTSSTRLRAQLGDGGRARLEELRPDLVAERLHDALRPLLEAA